MKKISLLLAAAMLTTAIFAQQDPEEGEPRKGGFKKENLFVAGSATASFFNGGTVLGIVPGVGYSLNRFVDAGVTINVNYISQRDVAEVGDRLRQTLFGPGTFLRLYPVNFLFAQGQYELNFIKLRYTASQGSTQYMNGTRNTQAGSLLVGGGYCSGREGIGNTFYYVSIMFDVLRNDNSPYVNYVLNPNTNVFEKRNIPIIRAGFQIALFQGRNRQF